MALQIRPAHPTQLADLAALLIHNDLSGNNLPAGLVNFWLALDGDKLIGSIGIEPYGNAGLLRSVCVDAAYRNQGIARQLFEVARQEARRQDIRDLYLLTTTADRYFDQLGFARVERITVPDAIQQTGQFSSLCPSSAIVMKRIL